MVLRLCFELEIFQIFWPERCLAFLESILSCGADIFLVDKVNTHTLIYVLLTLISLHRYNDNMDEHFNRKLTETHSFLPFGLRLRTLLRLRSQLRIQLLSSEPPP